MAQSAGVAENTEEGQYSSHEYPVYDAKHSDGETPLMLDFGKCGVPF